MPRRPRPRTVALPLAVTLLILVGVTAVLTHPDEAITVTITGTFNTTNPPGSFGPRTFTVTGTVRSGGVMYKKFRNIFFILVRKDERSGLVDDVSASWPQMGMQTTTSVKGSPEDGSESFTLDATPSLPIDESNLFFRLMTIDTAGRLPTPFDTPVKRD